MIKIVDQMWKIIWLELELLFANEYSRIFVRHHIQIVCSNKDFWQIIRQRLVFGKYYTISTIEKHKS